MTRRLVILILILMGMATQATAYDIRLRSTSTRYRMSYDPIPVSASETMGAAGLHYEIKLGETPIFLGTGGYGAVSGGRGGFFVGGLSLNLAPQLTRVLSLDVGVFMGGGGGASAFPGDGLMHRSHLTLGWLIKRTEWRAGLAWTAFPGSLNDHNTDLHWTAGLTVPTTMCFARPYADMGLPYNRPSRLQTSRLIPVYGFAYPGDTALDRNGRQLADDISLLGFQFQNEINAVFFTSFEAYGAAGGGVSGYAEALAGLGAQGPWQTDRIRPHVRLMVGMAGGGGVDTGGGLILKPIGGLDVAVASGWSLRPALGFTMAPDGEYSAMQWELGLARTEIRPLPVAGRRHALLPSDTYRLTPKVLSLTNKTYFPTDASLRRDGRAYPTTLQLLGVSAALPVTPNWELTGSAYGAWYGEVGAYAEGCFGLILKPWAHRGLQLHYELGVGAGGGLDTDSGRIHQLTLGWRLDLTRESSLLLEAGVMQDIGGDTFEAGVVRAGVTRRFFTAEKR